MAHLLVAEEVSAFHRALGRDELRIDIGVEFAAHTVPVEFLALEDQTIDVADAHTAAEVPELLLVIVPGGVGLHVGLQFELLVELLEEDALLERPARRHLDGVDIPPLGHNLIFDDTRVGNQRVDTIGGHHRDRVTVMNGRSRMSLLFAAGSKQNDK